MLSPTGDHRSLLGYLIQLRTETQGYARHTKSGGRPRMAEIVEFDVAAGGVLRVQAVKDLDGDDDEGLVQAGPGIHEVVEKAKQTLESALSTVTPALGTITRTLRQLSPDEVNVEFGFVLAAEHGVIVAKASGEVHFKVSLTWKGSAADAPALAGSGEEPAGTASGPDVAADAPTSADGADDQDGTAVPGGD
jgi:hypothetical protein